MHLRFTLLLTLMMSTLHAADVSGIQTLINQYLPDAHVGVYVQRADTGKVLVNINGGQHFSPASTAKLFTAYTALKTLGTAFQFNTGVYWNPAQLQQGVYHGPLYITFSGDPTFTSTDLAQFVNSMKAAGIKRIEGPILLDVGTVPAPYYARGWPQEDLDWYYAAPISAAIIDENVIDVQLMTTEALHQPVSGRVTSLPSLPVTSYVLSATEHEANHLCQFNSSIDQNNHITLYGCWPVAKGPVALKMAVANPVQRIAQLLALQLKTQQIVLNGDIKEGKTPSNAKLLTAHLSEPASALIEHVLRDSHNMYTEALGKQVGHKQYARATFQAGAYATMRFCYDTLKLPADSIELSDGSGLSTYNLATPQALAAVLKAGYADQALQPIWLNALAHSGQTGTLAARLNTQDLVGKFIGKTGAMTHVSNIAGYLFPSPSSSPLIVVVMINNSSMKKARLREFEVALMRKLNAPGQELNLQPSP